MLGRQEAEDFDDWLFNGGSKRPTLASRLLLRCEANAVPSTGEVMLSRAELAKKLGALPCHVSACLSDLERGGAIRRIRRGRAVRIFLNPRLGTSLGMRERAEAQADWPQLALIEGGAPA